MEIVETWYFQICVNFGGMAVKCENIRSHHECEGGIEKSILRITDWHHETLAE